MKLFLWLLLWSAVSFGANWEVGVAFLGSLDDPDYQADIDRNVLELARLKLNETIQLGVYREFPGRVVSFHPTPKQDNPIALDRLVPAFDGKEQVHGHYREGGNLSAFLKRTFRAEGAHRLLVVYGHGLGYEGLKEIPLPALKKQLEGFHIDILWLDACFMAGPEVAAELHGSATYLIASEEAEFSAGAPFDLLGDSLTDSLEVTAESLADRFLESYSFLKQGKQTGAVYRSSATVSVLALEKFEAIYPQIKAFNAELKLVGGELETKLQKIKMEKPDLVDFGALLQMYPDGPASTRLREIFELGDAESRRTNVRLKVEPPHRGDLLVFGYDNWTRGNWEDAELLEKLPTHLKPTRFVDDWPARPVNVRLYLKPFTVGLNGFDYYFADPVTLRPLTDKRSLRRHRDLVTRKASSDTNPVRFTGYTQGVGAEAERYTGLSVFKPGTGVADVDYTELRFFQLTDWASF